MSIAQTGRGNCLTAYQLQVEQETNLDAKHDYEFMQRILSNPRPRSLVWQKWLTLYSAKISDFSDEQVIYAIKFLNEQKAICPNNKPMKSQDVAYSLVVLLENNQERLLEKAKDTNDAMLQNLQELEIFFDNFEKLNSCTEYVPALTHFKQCVAKWPTQEIEILRSQYAAITLAAIFSPSFHNLVQQVATRCERIFALDSKDLKLQGINKLHTLNELSPNEPSYELNKKMLAFAKTVDPLKSKFFRFTKNMNIIQMEAAHLLKNAEYQSSQWGKRAPYFFGMSINNPWSLKALQSVIETGLLNNSSSSLEGQIAFISSKITLDRFTSNPNKLCPTQTMASRVWATVPEGMAPILESEIELDDENFVVAIHSIPDTSHQPSLILYLFQAYLAEVLYGIKVDMLVRFQKEPFTLWPNVAAIPFDTLKSDHDPRWRDIGIAANPTIISKTEMHAIADFSQGYISSGAEKPNATRIIEAILLDLSLERARAHELATQINKNGLDSFIGVGGSLLQIGIHQSVAADYLFLCTGNLGNITVGQPLRDKIESKKFMSDEQMRIIMDPRIFLNPRRGRVKLFPSKVEKYTAAQAVFRSFLDEFLRPELEACLRNSICRETIKQNLLVKELKERT